MIEGFAESINILVQNNSLRIEMKNNNLETIKKCDIENVKRNVEIYCRNNEVRICLIKNKSIASLSSNRFSGAENVAFK